MEERMKEPKDIERYATARAVAVWLRRHADSLEAAENTYPMVKVDLKVAHWNPDWVGRPQENAR